MILNPKIRYLASLAAMALLASLASVPAPAGEVELRPLGPEPHPYTTERGRFMLELWPVSYIHNRRTPERRDRPAEAVDAGFLLKYGLGDHLDVQFGGHLSVWERGNGRDPLGRQPGRGFGDLTVQAKYNLWGNDGGETAVSLMPFLTLPRAEDGRGGRRVQGGLMFLTAYLPTEVLVIEWSPSLGAVRRSDDDGYALEFASLLVFNRMILETVSAFIDFESRVTSERGDPWVGYIGTGLTVDLGENMLIEPAVHLGVTQAADDVILSLTFVNRF